MFLTQPALYGPGVDGLTGINLAALRVSNDMNGDLGWEVLELYNDVVRQRGKEADVLVIDLAREMPKNSPYYYDLMHYTNAGADLSGGYHCRPINPLSRPEVPGILSGIGNADARDPLIFGRSTQLEEKLRHGFKRTWVNNAGFCGYSTFGNIILVKDFLVKLHPKVLIFLVGSMI